MRINFYENHGSCRVWDSYYLQSKIMSNFKYFGVKFLIQIFERKIIYLYGSEAWFRVKGSWQCWWFIFYVKRLKYLIYLSYWTTKWWRSLLWKGEVKANKFSGSRVCETVVGKNISQIVKSKIKVLAISNWRYF